METIPYLAEKMQQVLYTKANELAWETGFMERERILTGSSFVVGLVSAWQSDPDVSLAGLSQAIGNAGTPISRQGVDERFSAAAVRFMRAMVSESLKVVMSGVAVSAGIVARFSTVELVDSSVITLPNELSDQWRGSGGYGDRASVSALKLSVRWEMRQGQLTQLDLSDSIVHDRTVPAHYAPVDAGSLQLRDLGYFKLDDLESIGQQGAYWLIRYKIGVHLVDLDGQTIELASWLPRHIGQVLDTPVQVGQYKRLCARLVAERVPHAVVVQRHRRIRELARQKQLTPSPRALELAHWTIYLTNVPPSLLAPCEVFAVGRYRWQIELLFKLWKSDLHIDQWRSSNPYRILCELYAKLIAAIVTHWLLLMSCWHNPRRSLRQAMPTIHALAWQWANSLTNLALLTHVLLAIQRALSHCHMDRSKSRPRSFQLMDLTHA
jgi:Transposase DDE domain